VASSTGDLILINLNLKSEASKIVKILVCPILSGFRKSIFVLNVPKLGLLLLPTREVLR
jgi:hypothetical protein